MFFVFQAWGVGQDGWFYAFGSALDCSFDSQHVKGWTTINKRQEGLKTVVARVASSVQVLRNKQQTELEVAFRKNHPGNILMIIQGIAQVLSSLAVVEISPSGYEASVQLGKKL